MSKKLPVGIQVYGLRDLLENTPENFKNVMQKVKELGYDGVELAGLYGLTPEYVKEVLDEVGLVPIKPEHNDITKELYEYMYPLIQGEVNVRYHNGIPSYINIRHLEK